MLEVNSNSIGVSVLKTNSLWSSWATLDVQTVHVCIVYICMYPCV